MVGAEGSREGEPMKKSRDPSSSREPGRGLGGSGGGAGRGAQVPGHFVLWFLEDWRPGSLPSSLSSQPGMEQFTRS